MSWNTDISAAPKDKPIFAVHCHDIGMNNDLYRAYQGEFGFSEDGVYVVQFGGAWNGFHDGPLPDFWFIKDDVWEKPVFPVAWTEIEPFDHFLKTEE